jgi:hypothetical protein
MNHLKKENELILKCACCKVSPKNHSKIKKILRSDLDWNLIINQAKRHELICFLYLNLKDMDIEFIPSDILKELQSYYFQISGKNLSLYASLFKLLNLLKKNNIPTVPFKGPVQAQLLYGDLGLRSFSDLDILVKKKDAVKTRDLLITQGFITDVEIPDKQIKTYLKKENFFHLANKTGTVNIDLHWEMTGRYSLKPIYYEDLEDHFKQIDISGKKIPTLSIEDILIHLCIHGTSHCWEKLEMICAIAEIIKSKEIKNWDIVIEKTLLLKCKKMVFVGLLLAEQLFEANLPNNIKAQIDKDNNIHTLTKKIINKIMNQTPAFTKSLSWRFSSIHFSVRDNLLDRVRYAIRLFFQPTIREWDKYPLPNSFLFLYYCLRPYRLISEGFRKHHA